MSPFKQTVHGLTGCVLAPGRDTYRLKDGTPTHLVAISVSLLRAEPCLRRFAEAPRVDCERAVAQGYRLVRSYEDAVALGLA
jgi:hypothetical protein